jgi:hypothetical protein
MVGFDVDWQHGAEHMWSGHQVSVEQANEALADDERIVGWRANSTERRTYWEQAGEKGSDE